MEKPSQYLSEPTPELRFVQRNGKLILQQLHSWTALDRKSGGGEWHDIEVRDENTNQLISN